METTVGVVNYCANCFHPEPEHVATTQTESLLCACCDEGTFVAGGTPPQPVIRRRQVSKRNVVIVRNALWKEIAATFSGIKKDFLAGETGIKAVDNLDKAERVKAVGLVERTIKSKLALADRPVKEKVAKKPKAAKAKTAKVVKPAKPTLPKAAKVAKDAAEALLA